MARQTMPSIPPGPLRELTATLHLLHYKAGWPGLREMAEAVGAGRDSVQKLFRSGELPNSTLLLKVAEFLAEQACCRRSNHGETVDDWCDKIDALFTEAARDDIYDPSRLATTLASQAGRAPNSTDTDLETTSAVGTMGAALPLPDSSAAVLAGISDYTNKRLDDLPGTSEQVERLKYLLTDPDAPVFDPETVAFLNAPSRTELLEAIAHAAETADDTVLVYFAGHGLVSRRGELLLAGPDTDPEADFTATAFKDIRDLLTASKAKRILVILDACYSGQATNTQGPLDGLTYIPTSLVLTSAGPYEAALRKHNGPLFTHALNDILETGIPDRPPLLDVVTIYREIRSQAERSGQFPIPHLAGEPGSRPIALGRNRALYSPLVVNPQSARPALGRNRARRSMSGNTSLGALRSQIAAAGGIGDPDPSTIRTATAQALGEPVESALVTRALIALIVDQDPGVRLAAARAVRGTDDPEVAVGLTDALTDPDPKMRRAFVKELSYTRLIAGVSALIEALADPDRDVRMEVADVLGQFGDPAAVPSLIELLADPDPDVRMWVTGVLGRLGDPAAVPSLIELLADPDPDIRRGAATALGRLGDPAAVPTLIEAFADPDPDIRREVVQVLGRLGDPAAVPSLIELLADPDPDIRGEVATALGRLGDPAAVPTLIEALSDPVLDVRSAAEDALMRIGGPAVQEEVAAAKKNLAKKKKSPSRKARGFSEDKTPESSKTRTD